MMSPGKVFMIHVPLLCLSVSDDVLNQVVGVPPHLLHLPRHAPAELHTSGQQILTSRPAVCREEMIVWYKDEYFLDEFNPLSI